MSGSWKPTLVMKKNVSLQIARSKLVGEFPVDYLESSGFKSVRQTTNLEGSRLIP